MQTRPVFYPGLPVPWAHTTSATLLFLCVCMCVDARLKSTLTSSDIVTILAHAASHFRYCASVPGLSHLQPTP